LLYCIVIFSFWEFFYFYSFSAKRYISKISKNNIAKSTLLVYHAYNDLWWLSGSTWCHSVCRTIFMNSNWFLLCRYNGNGSQDATARTTANEPFSRKINCEWCKWRGGESVLNETPLRASSRKPPRLRERSRRTKRSDIVSVKVGEVTLEINVLPVLHTKRISETLTNPLSTCYSTTSSTWFPLRSFSNDNRWRWFSIIAVFYTNWRNARW